MELLYLFEVSTITLCHPPTHQVEEFLVFVQRNESHDSWVRAPTKDVSLDGDAIDHSTGVLALLILAQPRLEDEFYGHLYSWGVVVPSLDGTADETEST